VVKGSEDHPSQYMNFMNVVFTAQKLGVVIDACILDNESGLLQQVMLISRHCCIYGLQLFWQPADNECISLHAENIFFFLAN